MALHCSQPCTASAQPHLNQGCCQLGGMLRQQVRPLLCQGNSGPSLRPASGPTVRWLGLQGSKAHSCEVAHVSCSKACASLEHASVSTAGPVLTVRIYRTPSC